VVLFISFLEKTDCGMLLAIVLLIGDVGVFLVPRVRNQNGHS
jgi:hypothetical protein